MRPDHWSNPEHWPEGPWTGEPNEAQWFDAATGLNCQARRNPMGAWCGYVGVPEGHCFYQARDDDILYGLQVHGGVTFSGKWEEDDPLWWFGFDCCHAWDVAPGVLMMEKDMDIPRPTRDEAVYRDLKFVKKECKHLASQLNMVGKLFAAQKAHAIDWLLRTKQENEK